MRAAFLRLYPVSGYGCMLHIAYAGCKYPIRPAVLLMQDAFLCSEGYCRYVGRSCFAVFLRIEAKMRGAFLRLGIRMQGCKMQGPDPSSCFAVFGKKMRGAFLYSGKTRYCMCVGRSCFAVFPRTERKMRGAFLRLGI